MAFVNKYTLNACDYPTSHLGAKIGVTLLKKNLVMESICTNTLGIAG